MTSSNASCPKPTTAHPALQATASGTLRSGGCASGGASGMGALAAGAGPGALAAGADPAALDGAGGVRPLREGCALLVERAPANAPTRSRAADCVTSRRLASGLIASTLPSSALCPATADLIVGEGQERCIRRLSSPSLGRAFKIVGC